MKNKVISKQTLKKSIKIADEIFAGDLLADNLALINSGNFPKAESPTLPQKRLKKVVNKKTRINSLENAIDARLKANPLLEQPNDITASIVLLT